MTVTVTSAAVLEAGEPESVPRVLVLEAEPDAGVALAAPLQTSLKLSQRVEYMLAAVCC